MCPKLFFQNHFLECWHINFGVKARTHWTVIYVSSINNQQHTLSNNLCTDLHSHNIVEMLCGLYRQPRSHMWPRGVTRMRKLFGIMVNNGALNDTWQYWQVALKTPSWRPVVDVNYRKLGYRICLMVYVWMYEYLWTGLVLSHVIGSQPIYDHYLASFYKWFKIVMLYNEIITY